MSATLNCCTPCATVETVNTPGTEGAAGADGSNGVNAYTLLTATITAGSFVNAGDIVANVAVQSSVWMVVGQIIIIGNGITPAGETNWAHFQVTAIPSATTVTLEYQDYTGDNPDGDGELLVNCTVSPAGMIGPAGP